MLKPWEMMAMDRAGYNGITDEHIRDVVEALLETGKTEIDDQTFERACGRCLIAPLLFYPGESGPVAGSTERIKEELLWQLPQKAGSLPTSKSGYPVCQTGRSLSRQGHCLPAKS